MTRGRRVPSAPPETRRQRGANIDRSPAHLEGVQAFMRGVALTDTEAATLVAVLTWAGHTQRLVCQSIDDMLAPYRDILEEMSPFNTEE
jgi:hypothetical protein